MPGTTTTEEAETDDLRFGFGENWQRFAAGLEEQQILVSERAIEEMLGCGGVDGRTFLDAGSGSGLSSLAAVRLGAARVHSFDVDVDSVACTRAVKQRFSPGADHWHVESGSATDPSYLARLGTFDIVYSWGVLHHTGAMWDALDAVCAAVAPDGDLFISIYNDQGLQSSFWRSVKRIHNRLPRRLRTAWVVTMAVPLELRAIFGSLLKRDPPAYIRAWTGQRTRGMSRWHDLVDWVGGYPFEVAKPEEVFDFCRSRGFELVRLKTTSGGLGCNQFVFHRPRGA